MIHILLSVRRPSFRGGAVSCSVFFSLFAGDSLWQVVFFSLDLCVCVCQGDLSMLSTMGCSTIALPVGEVFFANRSSQVEIVFFVILWPGDFGTFMRDAKRPESLPRNYHSWFQWSVLLNELQSFESHTAQVCMTFHCRRALQLMFLLLMSKIQHRMTIFQI